MENLDYEPSRSKSKPSVEKPRKRDSKEAAAEDQRKMNKKENRKSTPSAMPSSSSHGSPSRADKAPGSGVKRRDQPSGVGAVGGRGSILHNTVNPLLTEVKLKNFSWNQFVIISYLWTKNVDFTEFYEITQKFAYSLSPWNRVVFRCLMLTI